MNRIKVLCFSSVVSLLMFVSVGCEKSCVENVDLDCICTMEYAPVCGCNGKTYGNACMAECSGIEDYSQGECR